MNEVSRQQGWGFDGITQVPIGDNSARIAALKSDAVDACVVDIGSRSISCSAATAAS